MTIQEASNKKCPLSFHAANGDFNYCVSSDCMSWTGDEETGYCVLLTPKECGKHDNEL